MTIPILLSEAIALELRNILKSLERGRRVRWRDEEGFINFVDDEYITICIHRWEKPPEVAEHAKSKWNEVNIVCPERYWDELEIEDEHFHNKRNYWRPVGDHPGNDMLPPVKKR